MNQQLLNEINSAYYQLEQKQARIAHALFSRIFNLDFSWYNGYYHKNKSGNWFRESYPIPVIEVKGYCDIEIQFDKISVSTKLKQNMALTYSFEKFIGYEFDAYSINPYWTHSYHHLPGETMQELKDAIRTIDENEITFSFLFPFESEEKLFFEFAKLLRREGFFY